MAFFLQADYFLPWNQGKWLVRIGHVGYSNDFE